MTLRDDLEMEKEGSVFLKTLLKALVGEKWGALTIYEANKIRENTIKLESEVERLMDELAALKEENAVLSRNADPCLAEEVSHLEKEIIILKMQIELEKEAYNLDRELLHSENADLKMKTLSKMMSEIMRLWNHEQIPEIKFLPQPNKGWGATIEIHRAEGNKKYFAFGPTLENALAAAMEEFGGKK